MKREKTSQLMKIENLDQPEFKQHVDTFGDPEKEIKNMVANLQAEDKDTSETKLQQERNGEGVLTDKKHFLDMNSGIIKRGNLLKKGKYTGNVGHNIFELRRNTLSYVTSSGIIKTIPLHHSTLIDIAADTASFQIHQNGRTYELEASNIQDKKEWLKALRSARKPIVKKVIFDAGLLGLRLHGNKVLEIIPDSQADNAGVKVGWVVDKINGVTQSDDQTGIVRELVKSNKTGEPLTFLFHEEMYIEQSPSLLSGLKANFPIKRRVPAGRKEQHGVINNIENDQGEHNIEEQDDNKRIRMEQMEFNRTNFREYVG